MSSTNSASERSTIESSISSTREEMNLKKEKLLLDKLELDNEEQQARIAQLQIQWWQKPKVQYAIIVPFCAFVGFLAKNVTQDAVNQAEIQKQKNQIENQRLEFVQKQLAPRVAQLERAEAKLIDNAFRRYTDVCEIGGRIAAAESVAAAQKISEEFDKILAVDAAIQQPINQIKECLTDWEKGVQNEELARIAVTAAVLSLSYSCKEKFDKRFAVQFPQAVRDLTIAIYREAIEVAKDLRSSTDRSRAKSAVDRFLQLYYGKLVLVESKGIVTAMVTTNNELLKWKQGPPNRKVLDQLIDALTKESDQLAKQQAEELSARKAAVEPEAESHE